MLSRRYWFGMAMLASVFTLSPALAGPLHDAVQKGDLEEVKRLIADGADVNAKARKGDTPLHSAAWFGYKAMAKLLIEKGADVNAKTNTGATPLDWAIRRGHKAVAKLLKRHGAEVAEILSQEFYDTCMKVETKEIEAKGTENPRLVAQYLCKVIAGICRKEPESDACKKSFRKYDVDLNAS